MIELPTMSTKIPDDLKKRIDKLSHINWSEILRLAVLRKVEEEEKNILNRDRKRIEQSMLKMDDLRRKSQGDTTEELRSWREIRH